MTSCLGNIQWRWAPTALISCCNSRFLNASCLSRPPTTSFSLSLFFSLSFFNSHPSNRVSCSRLTSLRSSPICWARSRVNGHSRARLCFVSNLFDLNCFEMAPGFDLAPFRKNVVHSSPRLRCLGLFQSIIINSNSNYKKSVLFDSTYQYVPLFTSMYQYLQVFNRIN